MRITWHLPPLSAASAITRQQSKPLPGEIASYMIRNSSSGKLSAQWPWVVKPKPVSCLVRSTPLSRDDRTSWLAAYLSSALKYPSVASSSALSERYSDIASGDTAEVVFAVLDYKSPDLTTTSSNIGDYIQTLSLMRHLSRFLSPQWSFADPGLLGVFAELRESWSLEERREVSTRVHITTLDRDVTWPSSNPLSKPPRLVPSSWLVPPVGFWIRHSLSTSGRSQSVCALVSPS